MKAVYVDTDSLITEDVKLVVAQPEEWSGMVTIDGDKHLLECQKRNDKKKPCNCGATPLGSSSRKGK